MSATIPDRDAVVAATEPVALFGEAALTDALALRRAYATLAKAYRDDPEVTRHVRELYEQARAMADRGGPEPARPTDADPDPPRRVDPVGALVQAHESRDAPAMLPLLRDHTDRIVAEGPGLIGPTLQALVFGIGETLPEHELDLLAAVAARPDLGIDPELAGHLERAVRLLQEVARAEADPSVPAVITNAIRSAWFQPPHRVARVWLEVRQVVDEEEVDLPEVLRQLELRHPALLGSFLRTQQRMIEASEPPEEAEPPELVRKRDRVAPSRFVRRFESSWLRTWYGSVFLYVTYYVVLQILVPSIIAIIGAIALRRGTVALLTDDEPDPLVELNRLQEMSTAPLLDLAKKYGLWPREVANALAPPKPVPYVDGAFAYQPDHPLV
ncbi:MAG: hypothetical protein AAF211_30805, partial [Myxococcota bacterium]